MKPHLASCPLSDIKHFTLHTGIKMQLIAKKTTLCPQISLKNKTTHKTQTETESDSTDPNKYAIFQEFLPR